MRSRFLLAVVLAASLLLTAGCVEATLKTTVNADGSGDVAVSLSMTKSNFDQAKSLGSDPFAGAKTGFKKAGYQIADASKGDSVGFSASKHVGDVTGDTIPKTISEAMRIAENTTTVSAKQASGSLTAQRGLTSDTWVADFVIPTSANQGSTYKIQLVMPGTVGTNNADEKSDGGKTLQWTLASGADTSIKATSVADQTGRLIGMAVGVVVVVILIVVVVVVVSKRGKKAPAVAAVEPVTAPPAEVMATQAAPEDIEAPVAPPAEVAPETASDASAAPTDDGSDG
jgi:hypothetical protein